MTRNPLRLLLLGSLLAFVFVVAACGSDDNDSSSTSSDSASKPTLEGKKGGVLRQLGASDVDFLDPGKTYYTGRLPAWPTPPTARSTTSSPGGRRRCRTSPTAPPQISKDQKTVTVKIKQGVKFGPPVNREVTSQGRQVRLRALLRPSRSQGQYPGYFSSIEGGPTSRPTARRTSPASRRRTTTRSSSSSRRAGRRRRVGAGDADHDAGARGVRGEVRRQERRRRTTRTSSSTGPYMVKNDAEGNLDRLQARQVDRPRPQPELGREDRLQAGLPRRDQVDDERRRTRRSRAQRVLKGSHLALDTNPPAAELEQAVTSTRTSTSRSRAAAGATSR